MESNKRAMMTLLALVMTALFIFGMEKKFLFIEKRGSALSHYEDKITWADKILLLIDDFEGLTKVDSLKKESFFTFGSTRISVDTIQIDGNAISSKSCSRNGLHVTTPALFTSMSMTLKWLAIIVTALCIDLSLVTSSGTANTSDAP